MIMYVYYSLPQHRQGLNQIIQKDRYTPTMELGSVSSSLNQSRLAIYINLPSRLLLFDPSQNRIVCRKGRLNGNNSYSFYLPQLWNEPRTSCTVDKCTITKLCNNNLGQGNSSGNILGGSCSYMIENILFYVGPCTRKGFRGRERYLSFLRMNKRNNKTT